jgi:hypothetical protein
MYSGMNRLYKKPTVNPAFKLRQPLPLLTMALLAKDKGRQDFPIAEMNKQTAPTTPEPAPSGLISVCKNFAFNNVF